MGELSHSLKVKPGKSLTCNPSSLYDLKLRWASGLGTASEVLRQQRGWQASAAHLAVCYEWRLVSGQKQGRATQRAEWWPRAGQARVPDIGQCEGAGRSPFRNADLPH